MPSPKNRPEQAPSGANFQSIFEVVSKHLGVGRQMQAIRVCQSARQILARLLPDFPDSYSVVSYQKGILHLSAANAMVAQKLQMHLHLLKDELNAKFGAAFIDKITIR